MDKTELQKKNTELEPKQAHEILEDAVTSFGDGLVLASSLGAEDQVLTHLLLQVQPNARIFVLDTGRLHPETYEVMAETEKKYGMKYELYFPKTEAVESLVREKGINSFYESIENRKECCYIRKVEPLNRVLASAKAWITGIRRSQAVTRANTPILEWDDEHSIAKYNPLATWSEDDVWSFIKEQNIPYNALHDKGFPSIGCAPCTRAVEPGEDVRSGRWWWESPESKECGLHVVDGKLVRKQKTKEKEAFES
jgi:phosphoadenosine phosphosulfate reductase